MQLTLTLKDVQDFTLHYYFFGQSPVRKYLRILMGPVLILMGFFFLMSTNNKFANAYGGLCIGYGIYYAIRPFIIEKMRKFKDEAFSFEITLNKLSVTDRISNSVFDLIQYPIRKNSKYYFLKLENEQFIIFPIKKLTDETIKQFELSRITS